MGAKDIEQRPIRVLLIEDNEVDARVLRQLLSKSKGRPFEIEWANRLGDGLEALAKARFDVILLDLSLPDSEGYDTFARAHAQAPGTPIVVLTVIDDEAFALEMLKHGAQDYSVKWHADVKLLERSIRYAIERKRAEAAVREAQEALERRVQERTQELSELNEKLQDEIAKHRRAVEALRISEERHRIVTELTSDYVILSRLEPHGDTVIEWATDGFTRTTGYTLPELETVGGVLALIHPNDLAALRRTQEQLLAGQEVENELRILTRSGETRWVRYTARGIGPREPGKPLRVLSASQDVTERKRAEERYRELFENAIDTVYTHDLQGIFTSINKAGERTTGYLREELIGTNVSALVAPEHLELVREQIKRKVGGQSARTTYEIEIVARDGRRVPIEISTRLIYDGGKPVGVQGIARDIPERKHLEDQLRQAQKMEAVGRLAGGVAHDFNNLLTAIIGYSDLLLLQLATDHPQRHDVEEIRKAADRAAALTRQLLAFSRRQILAPQTLDLNKVVVNMDKMLRRLIGTDVDLVTVPDPRLGRVKADAGQIEQLLLNLALNARDAMLEGGKLTIETANVDLAESYARHHVGVEPGHYVMLAVSDTGCGMSPETQAHLFEPFFTTKEIGKGTGLGLSTVYGIVKQSGGHISVYSQPGRGATFKVYLPRLEGADEITEGIASLLALPRGDETILLVENEEGVRAIVRQVLQGHGYQVLEAAEGLQAISAFERHQGPIHLLITDVLMPNMDGPDLADRLIRLRSDLKVVFISGYTDNAILRHGILKSTANFLQKPFTPQDLLQKVRQTLDMETAAIPSAATPSLASS